VGEEILHTRLVQRANDSNHRICRDKQQRGDRQSRTDVSPQFGEVIPGLEAAQEVLHDYWEAFEDFHVELEEVLHADEEQVVDAVRDGGGIRGSDAEVWNRFFHVWSFVDGKIVRLSIHTDRNRALEAAGLRE
jgi:ketosteroid isomerase-like protein